VPTLNKIYGIQGQAAGTLGPGALRDIGPVLQVEISVPNILAALLAQQGQAIPAPLTGLALVDTGARTTCVDGNSFAQLGVNPIGVVNVLTAAGAAQQPIYPARFRFPEGNLDIEFNSVIGADLTGQVIPLAANPGGAPLPVAVPPVNAPPTGVNLIALIGRDLLSTFTMTYHGQIGLVTLSF
jgi:hypothetical protein